jgi:hypothetical protein
MIQMIYGKKGSGNTKRILNMANDAVEAHTGSIAFIDDDNSYMFDLKNQIRFINATEYHVSNPDMFLGLLKGILASNYDLSLLFVDGFLRIVKAEMDELSEFFHYLEKYADKAGVTLVLSISGDQETAPEYARKYII